MHALEKIKGLVKSSFQARTYLDRITYDAETKNLVFPPEVTTPNNKVLQLLYQCGETSTAGLSSLIKMDNEELEPVIADLRERGRIKTVFMGNAGESSIQDCHRFAHPDPLPVRLAMQATDVVAPFIQRKYAKWTSKP